MKVGVTGLCTPREWSFAETLDRIKSFGYDAFEPIITDEGEITINTPEAELALWPLWPPRRGSPSLRPAPPSVPSA